MKVYMLMIVMFMFAAGKNTQLFAQGMVRSTGIGVRGGFWDVSGQSTRINVNSDNDNQHVQVNGAGGELFFFSRAANNLFFELSIGGAANVDAIGSENDDEQDVDVETIIPFLLGLRYDFLSSYLSGSFHPYIIGAAGPYWSTSVNSKTTTEGTTDSEVATGQAFGGCLGGGVNIILSSWFALNFDTRYHFVDMKSDYDYTGMQFALGCSFMWGKKREAIKVLGTKIIVQEIYPAYYQFYSIYPLAYVTVKNMLGKAVEVNVRCSVKGYSERPKESGFIRLEGGETQDIPVTVFFSPKFLQVPQTKTAILDLFLEARAASVYRQNISQEIVIHSRNAWSGEMDKLTFYLTPEEPNVLSFARQATVAVSPDSEILLQKFNYAQNIFNELTLKNITYLPDPNVVFYQDDRVQFAAETLDMRHGDCDDLVVLYCSLLESLGIQTAFIETRDPEKEIAHLYMMFDSGLDVSQGDLISSNEKRYIIRENQSGKKRIWVPVETTLIPKGFEQAWTEGATSYLKEGVLRNGLSEGWVKVIDNH